MAWQDNHSPYGGSPYGSNGSAYGNSDPYGGSVGGSPYGDGGRVPDPYASAGQSPYGTGTGRASDADPYRRGAYEGASRGQGYGAGRTASPYAGQTSRGARAQQGPSVAYPAGSGRTYESSRAPRAAGVRPVTGQDYVQSAYNSGPGGPGRRGPKMSRRSFIAAAGGAAAAVVLGAVGVTWFVNRAVAFTVNGEPREAPRGSKAADIIKRGYASPVAGNLVSIAAEGETPEVLKAGGGNPYTLTVNGEPVDPETYRLAAGDVLEFSNGTDVTEEVTQQNTEIPFKAQIPQDGSFLVKIGYVAQWGRNGVSTVETGTVSGKTIDRGVTQEPQDFIIACAESINPADGRKLVALTFDDGPDPAYTPQYLDILAQYGAKATFFNLGSQVDAGPEYAELSKRCADEGHQVASHTYSHQNLLDLSADGVKSEVDKAFTAVSNATGVPTNVMRPPYGNFYGNTFLNYLKEGGDIAYSAYWGVDSDDWGVATNGSGIEDGAQQIINNCTVGLTADSYNGAVILMHDSGGNRDRDVAALPGLIQAFQSYGYELVTMNELLAACGTFPEWVTSGYATRPEGAQLPGDATEITYYDPYTYNPLAPTQA